MSDENKKNQKKSEEQLKKERKEKAQVKMMATKKVRELSGDSKWSILQQIAQEILATYVIQDQKPPSLRQLREDLIKEVENRYSDQPDVKQILMDGVPSIQTIKVWRQANGWEEAVWDKIKDNGVFTKERRTKLLMALYDRALKKSDNAAKLWLTLSGDYSEKLDIKQDNTLDKFREINNVLHKKSKSE